jgi:Ca2+:H+ antiporter
VHHPLPNTRDSLLSAVFLCVALIAVIGIAKMLSYPLKYLIADAGLAPGFLGVLIAMVVLLPESVASLRAAMANQLQNALNLALGSALASVGLTIPAVAVVSIILDLKLQLGLPPQEMVMLGLTYIISTLTLATGRTTVLHGAVLLVIFSVFVFLAAFP